MAKTEGQIDVEIRAVKNKCIEILKHLETLKKEGIYDEKYIDNYKNLINSFSTLANGADGLQVRSKNYFKALRENSKKK
jgi:hypothetical protein